MRGYQLSALPSMHDDDSSSPLARALRVWPRVDDRTKRPLRRCESTAWAHANLSALYSRGRKAMQRDSRKGMEVGMKQCDSRRDRTFGVRRACMRSSVAGCCEFVWERLCVLM